jgi:outer membrane biosynthesis protein TonB
MVIACCASPHPAQQDEPLRGRPVATVASEAAQASSPGAGPTSPERACVAVDDLAHPPKRSHGRQPDIPDRLRQVRTHGGVLVYNVTIGTTGAISDVQLAKPTDTEEPWPSLARLYRDAILDWQYEPSLVGGRPVSVCLTVTVLVDVT